MLITLLCINAMGIEITVDNTGKRSHVNTFDPKVRMLAQVSGDPIELCDILVSY